jgi:hypothetical protein
MNNLFIIGNGFDISHGLKTKYENFKHYLLEKYEISPSDIKEWEYIDIPYATQLPDGGIEYYEYDIVIFLLRLISIVEGDKWCDLENSLGMLDFEELLDSQIIDDIKDKEGHIDFSKTANLHEDISNNLRIPIKSIINYFSQWINEIILDENTKKKSDFEIIANFNSDMFLSFNYTRTLEEIYDAKNVCHVHGEQQGELIFGHGNKIDFNVETALYFEAAHNLDEIHYALKKDTVKALNNNQWFFNQLSQNIKNIFSYGFSFSEVDKIYIREICRRLNTDNIIWYLNDFDSEKTRKNYIDIIRSCEFNGIFRTYSILE